MVTGLRNHNEGIQQTSPAKYPSRQLALEYKRKEKRNGISAIKANSPWLKGGNAEKKSNPDKPDKPKAKTGFIRLEAAPDF